MGPSTLKGELESYRNTLTEHRNMLSQRTDADGGAVNALIHDIDRTVERLNTPDLANTISLDAMVDLEDNIRHLSDQARMLSRVPQPTPVQSR